LPEYGILAFVGLQTNGVDGEQASTAFEKSYSESNSPAQHHDNIEVFISILNASTLMRRKRNQYLPKLIIRLKQREN